MISRSATVALAIFGFFPVFAFGQTKATYSYQPCCGETVPTTQFASLQEELLYSQLHIEAFLLIKTNSSRLSSGVYLISASSGYKFQATVSRSGFVSSWYVTDPSGHRFAQVNASGAPGDTKVNICMQKFIDRVAEIETYTFLSRVQYGQQLCGAWIGFLSCLEDMGLETPQ